MEAIQFHGTKDVGNTDDKTCEGKILFINIYYFIRTINKFSLRAYSLFMQ